MFYHFECSDISVGQAFFLDIKLEEFSRKNLLHNGIDYAIVTCYFISTILRCRGSSVVERRAENAGVGSPILPLGTIFNIIFPPMPYSTLFMAGPPPEFLIVMFSGGTRRLLYGQHN